MNSTNRRTTRSRLPIARRGKSDPIDAEAAARKVLSGEATAAAKDTTGIVEAIRQINIARDGAVKARSAALCQLRDLIVTAPAALREQVSIRKTLEGKATLCARLRPSADLADPTQAAKAALRSVARRIQALTAEIDDITAQRDALVATAAPTTLTQLGVGPGHTATLLAAAGENIGRFHSEAAFAHLCAAAPIPASSGRTSRHRLNYAGNRQGNRALHMIVIVRLRYCDDTKAYMQRRLAEGLTNQEGGHPLPQALRRPPALPDPPRRPHRTQPCCLTSIGTSRGGSMLCGRSPGETGEPVEAAPGRGHADVPAGIVAAAGV